MRTFAWATFFAFSVVFYFAAQANATSCPHKYTIALRIVNKTGYDLQLDKHATRLDAALTAATGKFDLLPGVIPNGQSRIVAAHRKGADGFVLNIGFNAKGDNNAWAKITARLVDDLGADHAGFGDITPTGYGIQVMVTDREALVRKCFGRSHKNFKATLVLLPKSTATTGQGF